MILLVVSLAHDGITAWEPPLVWVVIPSVLYMWVGCTVHVSFTGWALPTQYLSLSVCGLLYVACKNLQKLDYNGFGVM